MVREEYFVNKAIDGAIKLYLASSSKKEGVVYNSFLVVMVRVLALIYTETDILNPYYLNNTVQFISNLSKYGMSKADIAVFKEEFLNYFNFEKENEKRRVKLKNPYFKSTLKYLVNMFAQKKKSVGVSFQDEEEFLELIYTSHTKNPYRVSYNYLVNDEPEYIEKYYYSVINGMDVTRDLGKTISHNLNLEALNYVGVNLSNLKNMSTEDVEKAQNEAYNYFQIDVLSPTRDEDLKKSMDFYNTYGNKVTTGNGYVDILLLMSVIATSISVVAIIIFSLM